MNALIRFSLANRLLVIAAWVFTAAAGIWALQGLPIDAVPDVTNVQVQVLTDSPGYAAEEVERLVTMPVERTMAGLPQLEQVRSLSRSGLSVVTVVFEEGTDIWYARQLVGERLTEAREQIPAGMGAPEMGPVSSGLGEIYQFEVRGEGKSPMELRDVLDWTIAPRLRSVPGVVEVNSFGGELRTYQVTVRPNVMAELGLTLDAVSEALERTNRNVGGGTIEANEEALVVRGEGLLESLDDIRTVVIKRLEGGRLITVGEVADVSFEPMLRYGAVTRDGNREAVVGVAMMLLGANARDVSARIHAAVQEIDASLPNVTIDTFYDRTVLVDRTVATVVENLGVGGGLVIIVLLLLTGSIKAGLLVALAIPLSFLVAVLGMRATGLSGNLMSLGAVDFGIIVDGSVVVVDQLVRRLSGRRLPPAQHLELVREATEEVARPTVFGVAIIGVVYLPILALRGIEGKMFQPMALTVLFALAGALLAALTITPVLGSLILRNVEDREPFLFRWLHKAYDLILPGLMRRAGWVLLFAAGLLTVSGLAATRLGAVFLPQLEEGDLALQIARLPSVGLGESLAQAKEVERVLMEQFPEVKTVVSKTGRAEIATDPMGVDFSDVFVMLHPKDAWTSGRSMEDLEREIKKELEAHLPGVGISLTQPIELRVNELLEGVRSDVGISLYGDDLDLLARKAEEIAAAVGQVSGAGDVEAPKTAGLPQLTVDIDRALVAQHGLDADQVLEAVAAIGGRSVGLVMDGERRFELRLRLPEEWRSDPQAIASIPLVSASGATVPLGMVANVDTTTGPASISRESGKRRVTVEANVRGRDLVSFVEEAKERVAQIDLPPGWYVTWGGQFQNFESAAERLTIAVPLALLLIFVLLHSAFRSAGRAAFVYIAVPFAASGGILALYLRDYPFSISAAVGFIALFGVAVMNGVVLMTTTQQIEDEGHAPGRAVALAASLRLRAVLMTALTDIIGFLPMMLSDGDGAEVQRPLATAVVGGLITATALTLLVFPAAYRLWKGRTAATPPVEAAGQAVPADSYGA